MADDFIDGLRAAWRDQDSGVRRQPARLPRHRFTPHLVFAFEVAVCGASFLVGLWFVRQALETGAPIYAYSAAALIAGSCAIMAGLFDARRASFAWRDESPAELVRTGVRRAEATLRTIRVGRWHVLAIAGFVAFLWCVELAGALHARDFLIFYSLFCAALGAGAWLWLGRMARGAARRLEAYRQLLADDEDEASPELS